MSFPPIPAYPLGIDSDGTLFKVYNTSESKLRADNLPWSQEVLIEPVAADADEIWAENGFATINGELFYYANVDKDENGKINKLKRCGRNLKGKKTQFNPIGTWVRGFVVAEHHNQLVDTILNIENFIGINYDTDIETLDYRIRHLQALPYCDDDNQCPDVTLEFEVTEPSSDVCTGTIVSYNLIINGFFKNYVIDFGDGTTTSSIQSGTHTYPPNSLIDPIVTVSNDNCQVVQSAIQRTNPVEPQIAPTVTVFDINVPEVSEFPTIIVPNTTQPETTLTLPQIFFPCELGLGPIGPIGPIIVPSLISVEPPIPSSIVFSPINIPSLILFDNVPSFSPIDFGPAPSFSPIAFDVQLNLSPIGFGPAPSFSPIDFGPAPTFSPIAFGPAPTFSPIAFGPAPTFSPIAFGPAPTFSPIDVNFGPGPTFSPIDFGPAPTFSPIDFGPAPSFSPIDVNFGPGPSFSPIDFGPAPSFSPIDFGPAPSFSPIGFGAAPSVTVDWGATPSISISPVQFDPAPSISPINFGPAPTIADINFGPAPTITVNYGTPPTVGIDWGSPPGISVNWGSPPACSCTVTVTCPSSLRSNAALAGSDTSNFVDPFMTLDVNTETIGIPSEINIVAPVLPDLSLIHNLPETITFLVPKIEDIKIIGPEKPLPTEIVIYSETEVPSIITIVGDFPKSIPIDASNLPSLKIESPEKLPKIEIDGSSIPTTIQVVGMPSVVEIKISDNLVAVADESLKNLKIPTVYEGGPIPIEVKFDFKTPNGDSGDAPCFTFVPCNK